MVDPVRIPEEKSAEQLALERRVQELEHRLAEAEANLQAMISQQIDAVLTTENTVPLLLRQAQQALQQSNAQLEQRVAQRTEELEQANDRLSKELDERKRIEAALFETEERLELLMDTSPDLIWSSLPDGKADYVNKTWREYTGLTLEEINQMGWKAVNHPEDAEQLAEGWAEAARNGKPFVAEFRYRKSDGSYHWFWGHTVPVKDEHGQVIKWVGVSRDITERKQMEDELRKSEVTLRESEMIYRAIGETIEYGIWICDPNGRNIYASQSYLDLLGITQEQCSEFGWGNSLHPDDAERTIAAWKECVRTEGTWDIEHRFLGRDGKYHPMLARGVPVRNEKGEIVCWAGINLDLSRIKQAEQARLDDQIQIELQRRLMEQREKERQGIARDIHDGPIQTLVSTLFNLQMTKEALNNPPLQVELNQIGLNIKTAVQELRDVVHELRPPSLQRFGLSKTILMHAEDFDEKHPKLELKHELADDQGKLSDEGCLTLFRIYQEALNNIVRHAEATRACVRLAFVEDTAILEIEDNGKGIEGMPDLISQTAQGHFGMAGMKERAETIRGEFQVQSSPGKGTIVRVTVPINHH